MFTLDQHRKLVLWYKDDGKVDEIPVTYYDGSFWDKDFNEYTFPTEDKEYWENFYKDELVRRVIVPSFDEDGNLKKNHLEKTMYEWRFVPKDTPKNIRDALMLTRPTKDQWQREIWDKCMRYYHKLKGEIDGKD